MRDHSHHIQVNKHQAVAMILENCKFNPEKETISTGDAIGRTLAEDVHAKWNSPNTRSCNLDSVAVRWSDFENGMPDTSNWVRGEQWEFGNTGVGMPEGFDTAIVVEHVIFSENDTKVAFEKMPSGQYAGTSEPGSKMKEGQLLVEKGTVITPLIAAYILSGNNPQVEVIKKPKVAFLPTGNELVPPTGSVPKGKNIESNSSMIAGKIRQWGGEPIIFDIVPDQKEALRNALRKAAEEADIIVLNAGSSKGNDDWGVEVLEEDGRILYHQTNHGPGHHSSFGLFDNTPVVGISGPPGGAAFTTDYYLYPPMMQFLGQDVALKTCMVRLASDIPGARQFSKPENKKDLKGENRPAEGGEFYSVKQFRLVCGEDGVMEAFPVGKGPRPNPLEAESADAYYLMPSWPGQEPPKAGDFIQVELRP